MKTDIEVSQRINIQEKKKLKKELEFWNFTKTFKKKIADWFSIPIKKWLKSLSFVKTTDCSKFP